MKKLIPLLLLTNNAYAGFFENIVSLVLLVTILFLFLLAVLIGNEGSTGTGKYAWAIAGVAALLLLIFQNIN